MKRLLREQALCFCPPDDPSRRCAFARLRAIRPAGPLLRRLFRLATPALLLLGCDATDGPVREWTAADHDQPAANQAPQVSARSSAGHAPGVDMSLIDLAWRRNCETCHGPRGRGDGPQGAMMRAPDLTRADWQAKVTDEEMAEVIRKGKNKMPGFEAALPPPVIDGMVKRIRAARAREDGPGPAGGR